VAGKKLSAGQVIAPGGDVDASPGVLVGAKPDEVDGLTGAITKEAGGELSGSVVNAEHERFTLKYRRRDESDLELAKPNEPHFTPGNRREWRRLHDEALHLASIPSSSEDGFDEALVYDAFACHLLTDEFAAGHQFDTSTVEVEIHSRLAQQPARPTNLEVSLYGGIAEATGTTDLLLLKNVHDRLNAGRFEEKNARGMASRELRRRAAKASHDTCAPGSRRPRSTWSPAPASRHRRYRRSRSLSSSRPSRS
jgi:hypothetical protein